MKHIIISAAFLLAIGCQESAPENGGGAKSTANANARSSIDEKAVVSDSTEGVVGPDEAFFAGFYLQELFELSHSSKPIGGLLAAGGARLQESNVQSAFDFGANFQPKRLELMCKALMKTGDANSDAAISAEEWNDLQYNPSLLGMPGDAVSNQFQKEIFDALAGNDDALSMDECKSLLVRSGPLVEQMQTDKSEMRRELLNAWEKILMAYDADKDGKLSLAEQRALRKARAELVSEL